MRPIKRISKKNIDDNTLEYFTAAYNPTVSVIQEWLNFLGFRYKVYVKNQLTAVEILTTDGYYGEKTERVIFDFQKNLGLYSDGIIGPATMKALEDAYMQRVLELDGAGVDLMADTAYHFKRVDSDPYDHTPNHILLRFDLAEKLRSIKEELNTQGARLILNNGVRHLDTSMRTSHSITSLHYLGLAFDLFLYSGMINPEKDPYVVSYDEVAETFIVFARCRDDWEISPKNHPSEKIHLPPEIKINTVYTYNGLYKKNKAVKGRFINLTHLLSKYNIKGISPRLGFINPQKTTPSLMSSEWWHFQCTESLLPEYTTFGTELLKVYSLETLEKTKIWEERDRIYGINWL